MIACAVAGDSIGQGIATAAPDCAAFAHRGWTSAHWLARYRSMAIDADRVVISLGSNDGHAATAAHIEAIRAHVSAARVVWIVPACNAHAARAVRLVAARHGDAVLRIRALSPDHIHPTAREYRALARRAGLPRG